MDLSRRCLQVSFFNTHPKKRGKKYGGGIFEISKNSLQNSYLDILYGISYLTIGITLHHPLRQGRSEGWKTPPMFIALGEVGRSQGGDNPPIQGSQWVGRPLYKVYGSTLGNFLLSYFSMGRPAYGFVHGFAHGFGA